MTLLAADVEDLRAAVAAIDRIADRHGDNYYASEFDAIHNARAALVFALREAGADVADWKDDA